MLARDLGCDIVFDAHVFPKQDGSVGPLNCAIPDSILSDTMKDSLRPPSRFHRTRLNPICSAGSDRFAVSPYGDIYPCPVFPMTLGSMRTNTIRDILNNSYELKNFQKASITDIGRCSQCANKLRCSICPGVAFVESGNYLVPSERACALNLMRFSHESSLSTT